MKFPWCYPIWSSHIVLPKKHTRADDLGGNYSLTIKFGTKEKNPPPKIWGTGGYTIPNWTARPCRFFQKGKVRVYHDFRGQLFVLAFNFQEKIPHIFWGLTAYGGCLQFFFFIRGGNFLVQFLSLIEGIHWQKGAPCNIRYIYIHIHIIIWKVGSAVFFIAHLVIPGKPPTKFAITNPANCEAKTVRLGDVWPNP